MILAHSVRAAAGRPLVTPNNISGTGGTVTDVQINGLMYRLHVFTESATFDVLTEGQADYLIVAGGGGGGYRHGAGGGAGGVLQGSLDLAVQSYSVVIGAGGAGASGTGTRSNSGTNSTFASLEAIGGGGGGQYDNHYAGLIGGSGGGAVASGEVGTGTPGQGYDGGYPYTSNSPYNWGGGGGAGEAGHDGTVDSHGSGGAGVDLSAIFGIAVGESGWFAGGGGAGGHDPAALNQGFGGMGGGGDGPVPGVHNQPGESGDISTGGGGGGAGTSSGGSGSGGSGGSGIVIIRYRI